MGFRPSEDGFRAAPGKLAMTRAILLHNPTAGRFSLKGKRLERVLRTFASHGIECRPVVVERGKKLRLERTERPDLLIVHGGDGTIHHCLPTLVRWRVPLAVLPGGTANVLAKELGIPLKLDSATAIACRGRTRTMYLGCSGQRFFHLMAGIGPDGFIVGRLREKMKRRFGVAAYWMAGFFYFWQYTLNTFKVEIEGKRYPATFALVSNLSRYGGDLRITPEASPFECSFHVCLFTGTKGTAFIRYLAGVLMGRHLSFSDVCCLKAQSVCSLPSQGSRIPVQMDGEPVGQLPMEFQVYRPGIEVVVPD